MDATEGEGHPRTIFGERWERARRRVGAMREGERAEVFARVLDHLEAGWAHLAPLAGLRTAAGSRGVHTPAGAVLHFIEVELVDEFRTLAGECADAVSAKRHGEASLGDIHADADELHRNLHLARLLRADPAVGPEVWQQVQSAAATLLPWAEAFHPLWRAMADVLEPPGRRGKGGE